MLGCRLDIVIKQSKMIINFKLDALIFGEYKWPEIPKAHITPSSQLKY